MDKLAVKGVKGLTLHLGVVAESHVFSERERGGGAGRLRDVDAGGVHLIEKKRSG